MKSENRDPKEYKVKAFAYLAHTCDCNPASNPGTVFWLPKHWQVWPFKKRENAERSILE